MLFCISLTFFLLLSAAAAVNDDCPYFCNCSRAYEVDCRNQRMYVFPDKLPNDTRYLFMDRNNISTIPNGALAKMAPYLTNFYMSYNGRHDMPFNNMTFAGLHLLHSLNLSGNRIYDFPNYIPSTVERLQLADNYANYQIDLSNHTNLESLDLSKNGFMQIDYNLFSKTREIMSLYMGSNSITDISAGAFRNNGYLRALYLDGNQLTSDSLNAGTWTGLEVLEVINLNGNPLKTVPILPPGTQELYLQDTAITHLHAAAFVQYIYLRDLYLSGTPFFAIEPEAFIGLTSLFMLVLDNCTFSPDVLGPGTLYGLKEIQILSLENSSVSGLEPGLFQYSPKLNTVNARGMQLSTLDIRVVNEMTNASLEHFNLEGNPFWCDCRLAWLKTISDDPSDKPNVGDPRHLMCSGPDANKGKSFADLKVQDFVCN